MNKRCFVVSGLIAAVCALRIGPPADAGERKSTDAARLPAPASRTVDYATDIRPIFAKACYRCHGPKTRESGLKLDAQKEALAGGDSGPVIVPGRSAASRLIRLVAGLDEDVGRMPPEGEGDALRDEQIALLRGWIDQGAKWPSEAAGDAATSKASDFWSLRSIVRPAPPAVKDARWPRNPIDEFVLAKLEVEHVTPAPEADRATLLRRVHLDLLGLPPTPAEVQAFLLDNRPDAYERVVDRLLESPHYGERWGRMWLDLARYADSDGFEEDRGRPFAWRYRDWVIDALNRDLPFDAFTVQQLAGDLLSRGDREYEPMARIATGFHRNTLLNLEGGSDKEEDRVKRAIDRTNTTGSVWLGLTVACANCHSHKYDPISQREYFQLYAFFNNVDEVDVSVDADVPVAEAPDLTPRQQDMPDDPPAADIASDQATKARSQGGLAIANSDSTAREPNAAAKPKDKEQDAAGKRPKPKKKKSPLDIEIQRRAKGAMTLAQALRQADTPRTTYIHLRGDFLSKGQAVEPNAPECLPRMSPRGAQADRLDMARWLVDRSNPLTARVAVNRLWQGHFGRGLVATSSDFGSQGELPSHPALLDWLAAEFREGGWSMKRMHRLIVTSATYRQSAQARPELADRDPENRWLARQNRLRVEAEVVRDLALAASGLLNEKVGGPSIRPPQPAGMYDVAYAGPAGFAKWEDSTSPERFRRGVYIWFQRISPYPALVSFDAPEANLACARRERSTTPLQSLTMLNDVAFLECAQALGQLTAREAKSESDSAGDLARARVGYAFWRCLGRPPREDEMTVLRKLYDEALSKYRRHPELAQRLLDAAPDREADELQASACALVVRAIMNLDEFITRE